jgi:excisionase family DNA binding protein
MLTPRSHPDPSPQKTLKAQEIRTILGISQKSLRKLAKTGRLRFVEISPGGKRLYLREDLDALLHRPATTRVEG